MCFAMGAPQVAVLGVLGEDHAGDLGVVARREEDEPPVVAQIDGAELRASAALRPCSEMTCAVPVLPRDVEAGNLAAPAGAGAVDDQPQPVVERRRCLSP